MKNNMRRRSFILIIFASLLIPLVFISGCGEKTQHTHASDGMLYTCPMHPQILEDKPGICPICKMDLVPFEKTADSEIKLTEQQQKLANIRTAVIGSEGFSASKQLNGRLMVNPEKTQYISARVPGRIEQLFVRQAGEKVSKGQPLYRIYSEQLASLQQEYLLAYEQAVQFPSDKTFKTLLEAAKQKLMLYGQTGQELAQLRKNKKTNPYTSYNSPAGGIAAEVSVTEGQYVSEGSPVMRIEDYSSLWVEADVYPAEAENIKDGQQVRVIIPGWENEPQSMKINFVTPALQSSSQTAQLRGTIQNRNNEWQPGLQANIILSKNTEETALSLPADAVIRDEKGAHVWIENASGKFEPRMVETGLESPGRVEIKSGLEKGDKVVISGAYLLYSEYVLKKGSEPMAGHVH